MQPVRVVSQQIALEQDAGDGVGLVVVESGALEQRRCEEQELLPGIAESHGFVLATEDTENTERNVGPATGADRCCDDALFCVLRALCGEGFRV